MPIGIESPLKNNWSNPQRNQSTANWNKAHRSARLFIERFEQICFGNLHYKVVENKLMIRLNGFSLLFGDFDLIIRFLSFHWKLKIQCFKRGLPCLKVCDESSVKQTVCDFVSNPVPEHCPVLKEANTINQRCPSVKSEWPMVEESANQTDD